MSTYTESLGLEKITPGSQAGLWGNTTNNSLDLIDQAITGVTPISFAGASGTTKILDDFNGAADEARSAVLNVTGSATGSNTIVVPNKQKTYLVRNETGRSVRFQTASPVEFYDVEAGYSILIFCDGNNNVFTGIKSPGIGTLSVNAGGTGTTSFVAGGFVKSSGGSSSLTASLTVNAASELSGVTPVSNGGTGQSSFSSGALLVGSGSGALGSITPVGYGGYFLASNGSSWVPAIAPGGISSVSAGTGISVSGTTNVTVTNAGVTSLSATGSGISVSGSGGSLSVANTGVTSLTAGTGVTITGGTGTTGALTISSSGTSGPVFSAVQTNAQVLSGATPTKITFTSEEFDTNNCYSSSRFTPNVNGYYMITACVGVNGVSGVSLPFIYKNGVEFKRGNQISLESTTGGVVWALNVQAIVQLNGSTDYVEIYFYPGSTTSTTPQSKNVFFQGAFLRGA